MIYKGVIVNYKLTHTSSQSTLPQLLELLHHASHKIINIKLMSVILLALLQLGASVAINHALLSLNESSYSYDVKKKVNVTIGEEFGLVMPGMDPMIANFTVYRLSQETFLNWFETQQTHQASPQKALAPNKTFSCQAHPASISIKQILTKMHKPSSFSYAGTPKHTIIRTYNLLYLLDPELNDLTAYYYNEQSMQAQASHRLPLPSNRKSNHIAMASSSNQSHLYVMTSVGIWTIETKTILARVNRVDSLGGFTSRERKVDDLLHGWNGWLVGINKLRAVYIIPENPSQQFQQIREYKNEYLAPQDIYIQDKYLYILDLHKGIYIYKRFVNGSILEHDFIQHESYGNMKLIVKDESIFVNYNDEYGNKIIQINYPRERGAELVRYYKDEEFITSMSVSRVRVSSPDAQGENSKEDLLFLMADNGDLLAYPYNVDPRTLHTPHNGIKTLIEGGNSLHFISGDRYLVITSTGFLYARIQIKRPQLLCRKNAHDHHMFYQISFESNVSSCQHFSHSIQPEKLFYNTNCRLTTTYTINVNDPYKSWVEKLYLYGVVILTIGAFIVGLIFMVEWRRNKLFVLGKIKDQIQKFREKHRKMQPFTEDIQKKQDIEFQLPEPPIDHDLD